MIPDPAVVVLQCYLCEEPADGLIVTVRSVAWWAAMNHALDEHRAQLIAEPRRTQRVFTMTSDDGPPRHLRPGDPTTRSSSAAPSV